MGVQSVDLTRRRNATTRRNCNTAMTLCRTERKSTLYPIPPWDCGSTGTSPLAAFQERFGKNDKPIRQGVGRTGAASMTNGVAV